MATVWKESCDQAHTMIDHLAMHPGGNILEGLRSLAINVLGAAGYGHSQSWSPDFAKNMGEDWGDARTGFFKTVALVADNLPAASFIPSRIKQLSFMPETLRTLGRQMANVPGYVRQISEARLQKQQADSPDGKKGETSPHVRHNMLDALLEYSQNAKGENNSGLFLTEDELSGNLWVLTAAGFDTTANTMGYAVIMLTVYPKYQQWIREELRQFDADVSQWDYKTIFPQCPRIMAVMVNPQSASDIRIN
jgi:cytochrome P450